MVALLNSMDENHPGQAVLVLSNDARAGGLVKAKEKGVATAIVDHRAFASREDFEAAINDELARAGADLVCLAGFMRILGRTFIQQWTGRCLNIHPSLLPAHKGLNTHSRAIAAGDTKHGCTVHEVTGDLDDGPILGQAIVPVWPDDTPQTLAARVLVEEHRLYPQCLRSFASL